MIPLEWNALWAEMYKNPSEWVLTTYDMYEQMLYVLPPTLRSCKSFLYGEAHTDCRGNKIYACFKEFDDGSFRAKFLTAQEYLAEECA